MADPVETLITSDLSGSQWSCSAWDPRTGTNLMVYKGGGAANAHSLCLLKKEFVVAANSTKPLIHIWAINSQDQIPNIRYVAPGKVNSLAVSPDGNYLLAGVQENICVWQICSGRMMRFLSKHYQDVTTLKFTDDSSHFISGGQDGFVLTWNLTYVLEQSNPEPVYSFSDHALPVTDVYVGTGGMRACMTSVSLDRTCRVYNLASGELLLNLVFASPLLCVTMNALETAIYIGSAEGPIFEFNIASPPRTKEYAMTDEDYSNKIIGHRGGTTVLAISLDGETLASGGKDDNVHIWNIPSRQLIRTLPHKGAITNVLFQMTTRNIFNPENQFSFITSSLKRMVEPADDSYVVEILVNDEDEDISDEHYKSSLIGASSSLENNQELEKLREEVRNLKKINKDLFHFSVKKILNSD